MDKDLIYDASYWQRMAAESYMLSLSCGTSGDVRYQIWWQKQAAMEHKIAWEYLAKLIGAEIEMLRD